MKKLIAVLCTLSLVSCGPPPKQTKIICVTDVAVESTFVTISYLSTHNHKTDKTQTYCRARGKSFDKEKRYTLHGVKRRGCSVWAKNKKYHFSGHDYFSPTKVTVTESETTTVVNVVLRYPKCQLLTVE